MGATRKKKRKSAPAKRMGRPPDESPAMLLKERLFAEAFQRTGCAVKSAKMTGIRGKSRKSASAFLKRPGVQRIINDDMAMRAKASGVTKDRVLNELAALAFTLMTDYATWDDQIVTLTDSEHLTRTQARAIQSVSSKMSAQGVPNVTVKLYDKIKALELFAKYFGIIGPEADGNSRPQAQELALRIRALVTEADEKSGGESDKPVAKCAEADGKKAAGNTSGKEAGSER